jgi:membrane protease YdiL (CAAX protease family)
VTAVLTLWQRLPIVLRALLAGVAVAAAGTLPWAGLSLANQKYLVAVPWSVVVMAIYLWLLWRWLRGDGWPSTTAAARRAALRANSVDPDAFGLAIFAALIGFAALMPFAILLSRLVTLNASKPIELPPGMPGITAFLLLAMASVVAGVVEESAFRGYMQGPIERRHGPATAIALTGALFGLAHFTHHPGLATLAILPYYLLVAAIYGMMAYGTNSIWPGIVLHAGGDIVVFTRWWATGRAEWEVAEAPPRLVWETGPDTAFWGALVAFLLFGALSAWLFATLASTRASRSRIMSPA